MQLNTLTLTDDELVELTHRKQPSAQIRALRFMGIEHRRRADGTVLVLRSHVEKLLGGDVKPAKSPRTEPNWDAIK